MSRIDRRTFLQAALSVGATAAWGNDVAHASRVAWREQRTMFPEGVASGDPDHSSVLLWTRRPYAAGVAGRTLHVEGAEDRAFGRVVVSATARVSAESDWTCRVLAGGLKPARVYWYRFTDSEGNGSRVGRTRTAPADGDDRAVRFAFVSCQDVNEGKLNAYRRMIFEEERAAPADQLGFVLHLGDFIYEVVEYPEEVKTRYDRTIYEVARIPDGGKVGKFHYPLTVDGYRAIYRGYLADTDLQDARARWPFVAMWDNHEFSWLGRQGFQGFGDKTRPAQRRKGRGNQAWFESQPARVKKPSASLERFDPPRVEDAPVTAFDAEGLGSEPNNLAAIGSLTGYRALRWGRHVDLILTDQHSYRSEDFTNRPEAAGLATKQFPELLPQEALEVLDGGRAFGDGNPPARIRVGPLDVP